MKTTALVLLMLSCSAPLAHAAFYEWVDSSGVTHFTDDHSKIPAKYRKKAKKVKIQEEPAQAREKAVQPPTQPSPQQLEPQSANPGGHAEDWWRGRFAALRGELKSIEERQPEKQAKLAELRRQRAIYQRGSDREAMNALQSEISADESRADELRNLLNKLELDASRAAVPLEWRR
jgi:chromosome segregation ATPase